MKTRSATDSETAYAQGLMDGIAIMKSVSDVSESQVEIARQYIASRPHAHYSSLLGPYCVICHENIPYPYTPYIEETDR